MFPTGYFPGLSSGGIAPAPPGDEAVYMPKMLRQWAVYWAPGGTDDFGNETHVDPIQIRCRWEDVRQLFVDNKGEQVTSAARVFVDRDLEEEGGILWLGNLEDLTDPEKPFDNENAYEIRKFSKIPNLKNTKVVREVML